MRPIGQYREFDGWLGAAESIRDDIRPAIDPVLQRRATFYLASGARVLSVMGTRPDVIDAENVYLSESLLSDGEWFWRADLAHYMIKYGLALEDDFLTTAKRNRWTAPVLSDQELLDASEAIQAYLAAHS
jgi:hypothetical protein